MTAEQATKLLETAKGLVPSGVYAVQRDDYLELRNDHMDKEETQDAVKGWAAHGFLAHYN